MSKRKVIVHMHGDMEYEAVNPQGNKVAIDMYDPADKKAQSPMDLLLSALGSCSAVDAVQMMKKKRREITDFFIEVEGDRNDGVPAFYTHISMHFILVSPNATAEEFAKVVKLSVDKYCSVASSIKAPITYTSEVKKSA